jgi:hypothetical protein
VVCVDLEEDDTTVSSLDLRLHCASHAPGPLLIDQAFDDVMAPHAAVE